MYRLPLYRDEILQKVITSEMIRGFNFVYYCDNYADSFDAIKRVLEDVPWSKFLGEDAWKQLHHKIIHMYRELNDTEYEYTFDEMGEFLLYKTIEYVRLINELNDNEWVAQMTWFDAKHIHSMFTANEKEAARDWADDFEEDIEVEDVVEEKMDALAFVNMGVHGPYEELILWDTDFLFLENMSDATALFQHSTELGLVTGDKNCEPISGSAKYKISK